MPTINVLIDRIRLTAKLTSSQVSLKDNAPADQLEAAKKQVTDQGGKITKTFTLIKGFT